MTKPLYIRRAPRARASWTALVVAGCVLLFAPPVPAQTSLAAPRPEVEAGLGKGVVIRSPDDRASLNLRARVQVRSTLAGSPDDNREETSEMAIRRMRLLLQGNATGPTLTYYVQLSFANLDNEADLRLPLRDAYITWAPVRDLNLRFGQMKVPFSRQRVVSSSALQMVDRSIVVSELNLDRDVGLQLFSKNLLGTGRLGYAVGLFGGEGRNRLGRTFGYLYTARVEAWPFGPFDDFVEADVQRLDRLRVAVGASVAYNQNTNRPRSTIGTPFAAGDFDYTHAGVDLSVKHRGWSLISELMWRGANSHVQRPLLGGTPAMIRSRSGWGAYVQGGRMVTNHLELNARAGRLVPAEGTDPTFVEATELGAGVSYYVSGHDLKLQGDYFSLADTPGAPRAHQARVQFQLFF